MKILPVILSLSLLVSCSVTKMVQDKQQQLTKQYQAMPDFESLPVRVISWQQAWAMLERNNSDLQEAQRRLQEAKYEEARVFYDFIPMVDFGKYYNMGLFRRNNAYSDTNEFSFNVIFTLPSLMHLPIRKYTAALSVFKAEKDVELKRRELQAKLYKFFREEELAAGAARREESLPPEQRSLQAEKTTLERRSSCLELCSLLNDYSARWQPYTACMPRVSVKDYQQKIKTPDELTVVQMALMVEAARLRKLGVAIESWPQVNIDFYSPSLFYNTGGHMGGLMSGTKDMRMSLNFFLSLDTRGRLWHDKQMAEAEYRAVQEQIQQKMWQHKEKMALLLQSWQQYNAWRQAMESYCAFRQEQGAATAEEWGKRRMEILQLQEEFAAQDKQNLERECALLQEYGFPAQKP